jgi:hypothetical protein
MHVKLALDCSPPPSLLRAPAKMGLAIAILLASAPAFAQHDHAHEEHEATRPAAITAGVALVAASFDTRFYEGHYEGLVPSARWSNARFAAIASGSVYRLEKNGAQSYGLGDVSVHGQAMLVRHDTLDAGVLAGVSLPTGDSRHGMGMGHVMLMPGVFVAWTVERVRLAASIGYSRALGGDRDHDHGAWPLVAPMLMSEVSWNAGGDVRMTPAITTGLRAAGGVPTGDGGCARAIGAGRVAWRARHLESAFEIQAGLVGDPFNVRGVVSTMLSF